MGKLEHSTESVRATFLKGVTEICDSTPECLRVRGSFENVQFFDKYTYFEAEQNITLCNSINVQCLSTRIF